MPTGRKTRQAWWAFAACLPVTQPYSDTHTQQYWGPFLLSTDRFTFVLQMKPKTETVCVPVCVPLGFGLRMEPYDKFLSLSWGTLAVSQISPLLHMSHNCSFIVTQPFFRIHVQICPLVLPHTAQRYNRNPTGELRSCFWGSSTPPILPFTCADYFHAISPICPPWRPLYMSGRSSVGSHSFSHRCRSLCYFSFMFPFTLYLIPTSSQGCLVSLKEGVYNAFIKRGWLSLLVKLIGQC